MSRTFRLYRFEHGDGTAKEWAYADLGEGLAEIRWGRAGRLCQSQTRPIATAIERAEAKRRKGYRYVGEMAADGAVTVRRWNRASGPGPKPQPQAKTDPIDIAALLGGDDDGFYF